MCTSQNDKGAQSCKYCGYLFEDYSSTGVVTPNGYSDSKQEEAKTAEIEDSKTQDLTTEDTEPPPITSFGTSTVSGFSPLFVASRSLFGSILPAVIYLLFFASLGSFSSLNIFNIALIAVFVLIVIVPVLTTPRKYEFYDHLLRIHKIVGGDSEIPYTDLKLYDNPSGSRRQRIILSITGRSRPIAIPGNPENKDLGQNLYQFLDRNLSKFGKGHVEDKPSDIQAANEDNKEPN